MCQWYDFSNRESSYKLKCFLELFYVGGKVQPLEIHKPLMCIAYLLMLMFSWSTNSPSTYEDKQYEQTVIYSDKLFCQAVVEWLVATDQVRNSFFTAKSPA